MSASTTDIFLRLAAMVRGRPVAQSLLAIPLGGAIMNNNEVESSTDIFLRSYHLLRYSHYLLCNTPLGGTKMKNNAVESSTNIFLRVATRVACYLAMSASRLVGVREELLLTLSKFHTK